MTKFLLGIIILTILGLGGYYFLSKSAGVDFEEKVFTIQDQSLSILAPRDSILQRVEAGAANKVYFEYLKSDNISIVHIEIVTQTGLDTALNYYENCIDYSQLSFIWEGKNIEVCDVDTSLAALGKSSQDKKIREIWGKREEQLKSGKPGRRWFEALLETKGQYYEVHVFVGRKYFETEEGKETAKQIFESFSVKE